MEESVSDAALRDLIMEQSSVEFLDEILEVEKRQEQFQHSGAYFMNYRNI